MKPNPDFLKEISKKLERLNVASHGSPSPATESNGGNHLDKTDIMQWMGNSAMEYLKKVNKDAQ